ncbi:MAG: ABC transporter ATP-binding protein [Actinomycetota bacterium]
MKDSGPAVIEIHGLRKEFRRIRGRSTIAVAGLDLEVPSGGVFGFLGPNGSGKTTTIRCLLGLVSPTAGACRLLGASSRAELAAVLPRVGSLVEAPAAVPGFSGRRNLTLLGRIAGVGRRRVDDVLELVGLAGRAGDRVRTYSLGMRQRLGIAVALLKDPEVLILDEPANGLDPAGIKEIRDLLRSLGREGRTVFVSSHLLGEVQQMCDRVAILSAGRLIAAGEVDEVLSRGRAAAALLVRVDDQTAALEALRKDGIEAVHGGDVLRASVPPAEAWRVTKALADRGIYLSELRPEEVSLETVFLELTGSPPPAGEPRPDRSAP